MALFEAADIVELAMQVEKSGEAFYRAVAAKVEGQDARELFQYLAGQEVIHYQVFQKLSQSIHEAPFMTDEEWDLYMDYLNGTVQSAFFQGADKALALAETVTDAQTAIHLAIGFEKETLLFFYDLRDRIPDKDRPVVEKIVDEEKRHIRRLVSQLDANEDAES
jgi:rubrerythrin